MNKTNVSIKNDKVSDIKSNIINYFRGVRSEWGKITWPEKHQIIAETVFVVIVVVIFTGFIFAVDMIFEEIVKLLIRH